MRHVLVVAVGIIFMSLLSCLWTNPLGARSFVVAVVVPWRKQKHPSLVANSQRHYLTTLLLLRRDDPTALYNQHCVPWQRRGLSSSSSSSSWFATEATSSSKNNNNNNTDRLTFTEFSKLTSEIRRHEDLYYNGISEISDDEFDALVRLEAEVCQKHPEYVERLQEETGLGVQATRFGGRVGPVLITSNNNNNNDDSTINIHNKKLQHLAPMLSLENVHSPPQLQQWFQRVQKRINDENHHYDSITMVTEPKLDGLSLSLRYEQTAAVQTETNHNRQETTTKNVVYYQWRGAATRGNGWEGQNVTAAVQKLQLPSVLTWNASSRRRVSSSSLPEQLEVRGEVVLPLSTFQKELSQQYNFSNARNAASGILLRKFNYMNDNDEDDGDSGESDRLRSLLRFYAYDVVENTAQQISAPTVIQDGLEMRTLLSDWGFHVPEPVQVTELTFNTSTENNDTKELIQIPQGMMDYYHALMRHRLGDEINDNMMIKGGSSAATHDKSVLYEWGDYEMDGAVHKVSSVQLRRQLGSSNRSPRWAVAHKFPPQTAATALLGIEVQVGRTGALTPVAVLEPVDLGGVSVKRASLHNFGYVQQLLGGADGSSGGSVARGTQVLVQRAGDVIPQVVQRVLHDTCLKDSSMNNDDDSLISLDAPQRCPACGAETVIDELKVSTNNTAAGQVVRCAGPALLCPPRAIGALAHAYSRDALYISGLSEARIQQLWDAEFLRKPHDLFRFVPKTDSNASQTLVEQLAELPGWGTKSAQNLVAEAKRVAENGVSLGRFIYSLNIRHVGRHSANLIASAYGSVDAFLTDMELASNGDETALSLLVGTNEMEGIKGVGPVMVSSLRSFAKQKELVQAARVLADAILVRDAETTSNLNATASSANMPWGGLTVVFTGSLPGMSRKEAQEVAKKLGAKATPGSVSRSTDLVVAGEKGGKKLDQAVELGVRVIPVAEFLALADEYRNSTR